MNIKRRDFIGGLGTAIIASSAKSQVFSVLGSAEQVYGKPNLVFFLCDDMRYDRIKEICNDPDIQTPHLDQLYKDGMNFTRAYDTTPICSASRGQIFTGLYEFSTGCNFNREDAKSIEEDTWLGSYPVKLRENGYRTAFGGKEHVAVNNYSGGKKQDFDRWFGFSNGSGDGNYWMDDNTAADWWFEGDHWAQLGDGVRNEHETYAQALLGQAFIRESANDYPEQPFMLSLNFKAPHKPFDEYDPRYESVYDGPEIDDPANAGDQNALHLPPQAFCGRTAFKGGWKDSAADDYNTLIHGIDHAVGMVRQELEEQGLAGNTVVIFTSDNGYFTDSKGFGDKVYAYEEGARAIMMIYDPRRARSHGKSCGAVCGNIDITPTMLDLAGVDYNTNYDPNRPLGEWGYQGKSMVPLLDNPEQNIHESMLVMDIWNARAEQHLAVVTRDYKYINWFYSANGFTQSEELYHKDDDLENTNLKKSTPEVLNDMRAKYDLWLENWSANATDRDRYADYPQLMARGVNMSTEFNEADVKAIMTPDSGADYVVHGGNPPNYPDGYTNQVTITDQF